MSIAIFCPDGIGDAISTFSADGQRLSDFEVFAHVRGPVTCGTSGIEEDTVFEGHWHDFYEMTFNDGSGSVYYSFGKRKGVFRLRKGSSVFIERKVVHATCGSMVDRCSLDWILGGDVAFHKDPESSLATPPEGPDDDEVKEVHGELFPGVVFCKAGEEDNIDIPGINADVKIFFDVSGRASAGRMILRPGTDGRIIGPVKLPHGATFRVLPDSESPAYVAIGEEILLLEKKGHLHVGGGVPFAISCGADSPLSIRWSFPVSTDAIDWQSVDPVGLQQELIDGVLVRAKPLKGRRILDFAAE